MVVYLGKLYVRRSFSFYFRRYRCKGVCYHTHLWKYKFNCPIQRRRFEARLFIWRRGRGKLIEPI